jgi:hypothetical protein
MAAIAGSALASHSKRSAGDPKTVIRPKEIMQIRRVGSFFVHDMLAIR